ncbi:unnamed protein product [Effrenium voratum]|nr:unnamed protein product [Effrenium voratum]
MGCGDDELCRASCEKQRETFLKVCGRLEESSGCHGHCETQHCHQQCPKVFPHMTLMEVMRKKMGFWMAKKTQEKGQWAEHTEEEEEEEHKKLFWIRNKMDSQKEHWAKDLKTKFWMAAMEMKGEDLKKKFWMADKMKEHMHSWMERKECMKKCSDEACLESCPKPWSMFEKSCAEIEPIVACHKRCGHDHMCHRRPAPCQAALTCASSWRPRASATCSAARTILATAGVRIPLRRLR